MLDGAAKIAPMLAEAQRLEMPAIGMTDHGNMFGASEFYNAATEAGIKPIIGVEAYIAPGSRFDTKRILWGDPEPEGRRRLGQRLLHPHDDGRGERDGLRNLFKLSSLASFEGQLGKWSRMDAEIIAEHAAGIIATTGCPSGEVQTRLRLGHDREALESAAKWREIFGPDNYFLELMDHGLSIERRVRDGSAGDRPQARHPAAGHQRLPLRHPRRRAQPRGAAVRADRQDAVGPQPVQVRRRRLLPEVRRRDAGAVGRRGARRVRLDAADRRARAVLRRRVGSRATGCRSSRCPTGTTRRRGCATRWTPGWRGGSRPACRPSTSTGPTTRSRSSATRAIRRTS